MVEILLAIFIFTLASVGMYYLSMDVLQKDSKLALNTQASFYAQEGLEAVRSIRDRNFLNLVEGVHGLQNNAGVWTFGPPPEMIDSVYQRKIEVSAVYRNDLGQIDVEGSIYDPYTKRIESDVIWYERGVTPRMTALSEYLSDWKGDDWVTTTCEEFASGTMESTGSQESAGPPSGNCYMRLEEMENPGNVLSFFSGMSGNSHSNDVEVDGAYAYLVARKSPELYVVNISDPSNPVKVAELALDGGGVDETFVTKYGNYLYIGVGKKTAGLVIVDVSNPSNPVKVNAVDVGGASYKSAVSGNFLFVPVAGKGTGSLKVYDISNRVTPSYVGTVTTGDQVRSVDIGGNYAYVGLNNSTGWGNPSKTFEIHNITVPSAVTKVSDLEIGDWINVVKVSGPMAYLGTTWHNGNDTLITVNINNPSAPVLSHSLALGNSVLDMAVYDGHVYAAMDSVHSGVAAVNISDPFNPSISFIEDSGGKSTGIAANDTHLFVSIDTANHGMAIIEREQISVATAGSYISGVFDTGSSDTLYNYIEWDSTLSPGGSVKFQIRTADYPGNLDTASWTGPDGTSSTFYENSRTAITLNPSRSGNRYYQYIAYFTSDGQSTPFLESVRLNYRP